MPHLIPNLFEKAYTPYTMKLAPKNLWSRPALGKCFHHRLEKYSSLGRADKPREISNRS